MPSGQVVEESRVAHAATRKDHRVDVLDDARPQRVDVTGVHPAGFDGGDLLHRPQLHALLIEPAQDGPDDVAPEQRRGGRGREDDGHLMTTPTEEVRDRQRRDVIVLRDDEHPSPWNRPLRQHIPHVQHVWQVVTEDAWATRGGTGGDGHGVGANRQHIVGRGPATQGHLHTGGRQARDLPVEVRGIHVVARGERRIVERSPEPVLRLPQLHPVTRLGKQCGQFHSGRAASDDEHFTGRDGLRQWTFHFVAGRGVDGAREAEPLHIPPADALVATNAGADLGDPALAGLDQQLPVGDVRPSHPHDIGLTSGEDPLSHLGRVDPARVHDRQRHGSFEGPSQLAESTRVDVGRLDIGRVAPGAADDAMDIVDEAGRLEVLRELDPARHPETLGGFLADVEPDTDRHRRADDVADRLQDLGREATPVLERAAVSVGSVVRIRRQEPLVQVVVVEVQLESVGAAEHRQPSRLGILPDELGDVGVGHDVRDQVDDRGAQARGGGVRHTPLVDALHADRRAERVAGIGEGLDPLDEERQAEEAGRGRTDAGGVEAGDEVVADVGGQRGDPGDARAGALLEVGDVARCLVVGAVDIADRGGVRRQHDAVAQPHRSHGDGSEQVGEVLPGGLDRHPSSP